MNNKYEIDNKNKHIGKTWNSGPADSCTVVIPKDLARRCGLEHPSHVTLEGLDDGILIRKLKV